MKKNLFILMVSLVGLAVTSCSSDSDDGGIGNVSVGNVQIKSGSILGAKALAVASKSQGTRGFATGTTRAAGDAEVVDALYKVSDDGKFIEVNYTFDVEVKEGEEKDAQTVIQQVQSNLRITPNFIFNVGDDFLWLANCFYYVPNYSEMPEDGVKKALTAIRDGFNESHHESHGAHYLIRKSTGDMYEWKTSDAAPFAMADGYNPPSMLGRWFHAVGKNMYVRENFFYPKPYYSNPFCTGRVLRIGTGGSTLSYTEVIPASANVTSILPAGENLGVICVGERNCPNPYIYFTGANKLVPLETPQQTSEGETHWSLLAVAGELYAMKNYHRGDAGQGANILSFHKIVYSGNTVSVGEQIAQIETSVDFSDDKFFGTGASTTANTFTFFSQNSQQGWKPVINTFDPAAKAVHTRDLPAHYNDNYGFYIEGIACNEVTERGFYVCDLSKDEAEYVNLDWSSAAEWQSKVASMKYVHFEAAFMAVKYEVTTTDGKTIAAWVPITGDKKGKVAILTDENGDPNFVVNVLLSL